MRNLIYFVVGGERDYSKLLLYCINTIRCYQDNDDYDIMVMCDEEYANVIREFPIQYIHITPHNPSVIHVSMRKTEIFSFTHIHEYEKVLYLDCDIVVCGSLKYMMELVKFDDILYVVPESNDHTCSFFQMHDKPYDTKTLDEFSKKNIYAFNCGQFAFKVSKKMEQHFNDIANQIHTSYDPSLHFYEQCFMNNYFNRLGAVSYDIAGYVNLLNPVQLKETITLRTINHLFVASVHYMVKLHRMKQCHHAHIEFDKPMMCDSRDLMNQYIKIGSNPVMAEIGVFRGEFSKSLIEMYNPEILYMIDPWEGGICSGDMNGNNVCYIDGDECYNAVSNAFSTIPAAHLIRKYSNEITNEDISPKSLDLMYIDGDHSYKGVSNDLKLGLSLVKSRGFICGHDYAMNFEKTKNTYDFGVKQAVTEFCIEHGYRIVLLMIDGCVSFAIRIS